jgi:hypothetical protein
MDGQCGALCGTRSKQGGVEAWCGARTTWPARWGGGRIVRSTGQGGFRPKWLMEKGNWFFLFLVSILNEFYSNSNDF